MNYAKSGKQNPRGEQGVTVKGAQTLFTISLCGYGTIVKSV